MARNIGSSCRLCRREGAKLFLKGARCLSDKCAFSRRGYVPGEHGKTGRRKPSNYALQLREKQKVKRMYGVMEKQFRHYFRISARAKGITGKVLIQILERRVDNVILRIGFAVSHNQARQIVSHRHIYINNRCVNIPSYLVKPGDVLELRSDDKLRKNIKQAIEITQDWPKASWLDIDGDNFKVKVLRLPEKSDLQLPVEEQLIVELYSK